MFTESVILIYNLLKSRCFIKDTHLKVQMFEQGDSSNREKMKGCFFCQLLWQNVSWFLSQQRKRLSPKGLILKPIEKTQILLKIGTRDFQNSPPFERSTCFHVIITDSDERF